jgi:AraC-like DNA-binding protein
MQPPYVPLKYPEFETSDGAFAVTTRSRSSEPRVERGIHQRDGIGAALQVLQRNDCVLRRVPVDGALLVWVRHGTKYIRGAEVNLAVREGECVALAAGQMLDMINEADAKGVYQADCLSFDAGLIADFAQSGPAAASRIRGALKLGSLPQEFAGALSRAGNSLGQPRDVVPDPIARQRLIEVLMWLRLNGADFPLDGAKLTSVRVRSLLRSAPDLPWKAGEVARRLGMSEATLRRRLAAENFSFGDLLIDVRMSTALVLLQATERSITDIALSVGYESPSRFAVRFRERLGLSPTELRFGDGPKLERIGTKFARP